MKRALACAFAALLFASPASVARAFSDAAFFADGALEGGGNGRYFTGSPQDPFSCSVCHRGGETPAISIEGLPERFMPGERHDVVIRWTRPELSHALQLELMTADGSHADVQIDTSDELRAESRCDQNPTSDAAIYKVDIDKRRVIGVQDCGASELRFAFTAPDAPELFFSIGVVRTDSSGTAEGDGVFELRKRIEPEGARAASTGCSAIRATRSPPHVGWMLALVLCALLWRRQLNRFKAIVLLVASCLAACYQPRVSVGDGGSRDDEPSTVRLFEDLLGAAADAGADARVVECGQDPSALSELTLELRTVSIGGRFRPRNAGAIWIEDSEGVWVKTLERWGERRAKWLSVFNEASDGDVTDAVTSATLTTHRVHEVSWDLTGRGGCEVPNGSYALRLEVTERSATGENAVVPFDKSDEPIELMPADQAVFRDMSLRLQ